MHTVENKTADEAVDIVEADATSSSKMSSTSIRGSSNHKSALMFLCLIAFGSLFGIDTIGILQGEFRNSLDINMDMINSAYMILYWPNVFFCILHGFLIDHWLGLRYSIIIYIALISIGQLILFSSCFFPSFSLIMLGRFVFAVGSQSSIVAQNTYVGHLFEAPGPKRNLAFGLLNSFYCLGQLATIQYLRPTYDFVSKFFSLDEIRLGATLFLVSMVSILSLLCAIGLGIFDRHTVRNVEGNGNSRPKNASLSDIFTFKLEFWLVFVIMFSFFNAFFAFMRFLINILFENFYLDFEDVEASTSVILLTTIVASPLCGLVLDKFQRITWLWFAISCATTSYILLNFMIFINPFMAVILIGIAYGIMRTTISSLVAIVVPKHLWGLGFGLCGSILNLSVAISAASFMEEPHIAKLTSRLQLFFLIMLSISILATLMLNILYRKHKKTLNSKMENLSS